jgi:hypothetical protein
VGIIDLNPSIFGSNTVLALNEILMFVQVVQAGSFAGAALQEDVLSGH